MRERRKRTNSLSLFIFAYRVILINHTLSRYGDECLHLFYRFRSSLDHLVWDWSMRKPKDIFLIIILLSIANTWLISDILTQTNVSGDDRLFIQWPFTDSIWTWSSLLDQLFFFTSNQFFHHGWSFGKLCFILKRRVKIVVKSERAKFFIWDIQSTFLFVLFLSSMVKRNHSNALLPEDEHSTSMKKKSPRRRKGTRAKSHRMAKGRTRARRTTRPARKRAGRKGGRRANQVEPTVHCDE